MAARPVLVGFKTRPVGVEWEDLASVWEAGDDLPAFDSGWLWDHFLLGLVPGGPGSLEAWTLAAGLAARTRRIRLGHMVLGNTHRDPALLAWMAAAMDRVAGGRFILGLGAGWHEEEHRSLGWDLPPIGQRMERLEAALRIIRGLWGARTPWSFAGAGYDVSGAVMDPGPLSPRGPEIWLGTQGPRRGLRLIAELADGWITNAGLSDGNIDEYRVLRDVLRRHCDALGRDPETITIAAQLPTEGRTNAAILEQARAFVQHGVTLVVFVVDPRLGPPELQRIERDLARPLLERLA